ncbi:TetR family transcriptional regulator [Candidatus Entotheonella serta]|nr:TetR family transcriptional regulator [Candidatus Entotheonella serta]
MPRPKSFDPELVLSDAMDLFWQQGFEVTSIPQLERHLGINRFSIYDTFESKRALFLKALALYTEKLSVTLIEPLESGGGGLSDLRAFFQRFRAQFLAEERPRGCLMCNTAIELGDRDAEVADVVRKYFSRLEQAILSCLKRSQTLGEVTGTSRHLKWQARLIRTSIEGLLVELRLSGDDQDIQQTISAVESIVF